jgi:hypothetical protein
MKFRTLMVSLIVFMFTCSMCLAKTKAAPTHAETLAKASSKAARVDLNSASQRELEKLPGIGPAAAKKIIAGRPYASTRELTKAGISAKTIKKIAPMVRVGKSSAASESTRKKHHASKTVNSAKPSNASGRTSAAEQKAAPTPPRAGKGLVWVNTDTKVYHKAGSRWYGKTKKGEYMKESEAIKAGYRASKK